MRHFQFSLRTLLIVVALPAIPCGYVGWQGKIVRDRKATLLEIIDGGGKYSERSSLWNTTVPRNSPITWIRKQFGDEPVLDIVLPRTFPAADMHRIRDIFPEASVNWRQDELQ